MKVLFIDDENGHAYKDPSATLVRIPKTSKKILKKLEMSQLGVMRIGGRWHEIMKDGDIEYTIISNGKKSDYSPKDYDLEHKLVSGNY